MTQLKRGASLSLQDAMRANAQRRRQSFQTSQAQKANSGGFEASSLIQEGSSLGGAGLGAALGTAFLPGIGTLAGAGIGGALGSLFGGGEETRVRDGERRYNVGEALVDGALSAGPLKLLKGASAATKAARGGATLGSALKAGGKEGAEFTLRGSLGRKAADSGKNLAIRPLGLTKGQKTTIRNAAGGEVSAADALSKFRVSSLDDIGTQITNKQTAFDEIVSGINRKFTKKEVGQSFKELYEPLLKGNTSQQAVGQKLKTEADELLKRIPTGGLSGNKLNTERKAFQKFARRFGDNPTLQDTNEAARSATSSLLRDAAPGLKETGQDLNILRTAQTAARKNLESGTGRSGLKAGDFIAGSGGVAAGGPIGGLLAAAGSRVLASPTAAKVGSKGLNKTGELLSKSAGRATQIGGAARNLTLSSALEAGVGQPNMSVNATSNPQSINATNTSIIDPTVAQNLQNTNTPDEFIDALEASGVPINPETGELLQPNPEIEALFAQKFGEGTQQPQQGIDVQGVAMQLIQKGASLDEVQQVIEELSLINSIQDGSYFLPEDEGVDLTAAQAKTAASAQNALNDIPLIEQAINSGQLGGAKSLPGANTSIGRRLLGTENLDAALFNIADNILRARSGAATPEPEVKRFAESFLPNPLDSDEAKRQKLQRAVRELESYLNPQAVAAGTEQPL